MKPTALALNVLVASIATYKFCHAGACSRDLFLPLALASVPFAYPGGALTPPGYYYEPVIGGGIFLSPLLLQRRCAEIRVISGAAAAKMIASG